MRGVTRGLLCIGHIQARTLAACPRTIHLPGPVDCSNYHARLIGRSMASAPTASATAAATVVPLARDPVNAADFSAIQAALTEEDERREALIKRSRDVQKKAKSAIYDAHRGNIAAALRSIAESAEVAKAELLPVVEQHPQLRFGSLSSALEEWAEAVVFVHYLRTGTIPTLAEVSIVNKEEYLGAVLDMTGELGRLAVLKATQRDLKAVERARDVVDQLLAQFMLFDFRNGSLRRKYDALKYTLKKLEQICYELTLASSMPFLPQSGSVPEPQQLVAGDDDKDGAEGDAAAMGGAGDGGFSGGGRGGRAGGFKRPRVEGGGAGSSGP